MEKEGEEEKIKPTLIKKNQLKRMKDKVQNWQKVTAEGAANLHSTNPFVKGAFPLSSTFILCLNHKQ